MKKMLRLPLRARRRLRALTLLSLPAIIRAKTKPIKRKQITEAPKEITEEEAEANKKKMRILIKVATQEITKEEGERQIARVKAFN